MFWWFLIGLAVIVVGVMNRAEASRTEELASTVRRIPIADANGYVEISGIARPIEGIETREPLSGTRCLWYFIETRTQPGFFERNLGPEPVLGSRDDYKYTYQTCANSFLLDDETGTLLLNLADHARIGYPTIIEADSNTQHSVWMIDEGTRLNVVGSVRRLDPPRDGATHGLEVVEDEEIRVSLFTLQEQAEKAPESRQGSLLLIAGGVAVILYYAWRLLA